MWFSGELNPGLQITSRVPRPLGHWQCGCLLTLRQPDPGETYQHIFCNQDHLSIAPTPTNADERPYPPWELIGELSRAKRASGAPWVSKSTHPRKFGSHVTAHRLQPVRPSAPQAYQCLLSHFLATLGAHGA